MYGAAQSALSATRLPVWTNLKHLHFDVRCTVLVGIARKGVREYAAARLFLILLVGPWILAHGIKTKPSARRRVLCVCMNSF